MKIYFDTSALLKRYIEEKGSDQVEILCHMADEVGVSVLLPVEALSTLYRLKREGKLNDDQLMKIRVALLKDLQNFDVIPIAADVVEHCDRILKKFPVKSLDALQIGCGIAYNPDLFVSSDRQQMLAARKIFKKSKEV